MDYDYFEVFKTYEFEKKIRLGNKFDGGYVIADLGNYDCYISAGVGDDESFSSEFIDIYKPTKSFAFDGTIEILPKNFPTDMIFVKKNISKTNSESYTNLLELIESHDNIFLKMDIEGAELDWIGFIDSSDISKFKQVVIEFHNLDTRKKEVIESLKKINQTHYIIHAHGNNYSVVKNSIPVVIEVTYLRKKEFIKEPKLNTVQLPLDIDYKNNLQSDEIILDYPPFYFPNL
jgi:hypothetical protein